MRRSQDDDPIAEPAAKGARPVDTAEFSRELEALIPMLRGFARSLCRNAAEADDLAQETLLRAWRSRASYIPGTNMKAGAFTILRNHFYSQRRIAARTQSLEPATAERTLVAVNNPDASVELEELRQALALLPPEQREVVVLIGAGGMTYEEVAEMAGVPVGTIKSRLSRGRAALAGLCASGTASIEPVSAQGPAHAILQDVERSRRVLQDAFDRQAASAA